MAEFATMSENGGYLVLSVPRADQRHLHRYTGPTQTGSLPPRFVIIQTIEVIQPVGAELPFNSTGTKDRRISLLQEPSIPTKPKLLCWRHPRFGKLVLLLGWKASLEDVSGMQEELHRPQRCQVMAAA
jgi:hypothetical protein